MKVICISTSGLSPHHPLKVGKTYTVVSEHTCSCHLRWYAIQECPLQLLPHLALLRSCNTCLERVATDLPYCIFFTWRFIPQPPDEMLDEVENLYRSEVLPVLREPILKKEKRDA